MGAGFIVSSPKQGGWHVYNLTIVRQQLLQAARVSQYLERVCVCPI